MARISKGKLYHLWSLYDVWDLLIFRENDRKSAMRRKVHLSCMDTSGHTLTVETLSNGVTACTVRDSQGKLLAYDFEVDVNRDWIVDLDSIDMDNYKGPTLRPDGTYDLDVAETYPHTMKVFDEENFDRIIAEMGAQRKMQMQIPIDEQTRSLLLDNPQVLVELVDGVWRRKGAYPHELRVTKKDGSLETFDPSKAATWGMDPVASDPCWVSELAKRGYYEGNTKLNMEVDTEFVIHHAPSRPVS